jgi:hypothetical protein
LDYNLLKTQKFQTISEVIELQPLTASKTTGVLGFYQKSAKEEVGGAITIKFLMLDQL